MTVKIKIEVEGEEEIEITHKPDTCTEDDIFVLCYAVKRYLREAFGRAPNPDLRRAP